MTIVDRERAARLRSGRRIVLGFFVLIIVGVGSLLTLRATSLRGLPDIGDPFDVAQYAKIEIPPDENAYTFYLRAHDRLDQNYQAWNGSTFTDWTAVGEPARKYLEANRAALLIWFEGTKRDRALYKQPGALDFETMLPAVQSLRMLGRLANLEACRYEHEGDLSNSWAWLRANLRASRHCGKDGVVNERLVGIAIYATTSKQSMHWAENSKVDAKLLRQALDDVLALDALTPTIAEVIRAEYYYLINSLNDPELRERLYRSQLPRPQGSLAASLKDRLNTTIGVLIHEPERSRRVVRLVTANWLSAANLPATEGATRLTQVGELALYTPAAVKVPPLPLKELGRWFNSTLYAKTFFSNWSNINKAIARDEQNRGALIVHLAEQLYIREHGKPPESIHALVGPYLKSLPAGYAPSGDDPRLSGTLR